MSKNYYSIYLIFITLNTCIGQNLVLNSSFEEYHTQPYLYSVLDSFFCYDWYNPLESTPDFYTTEALVGEFRLPYNAFGKISPYDGKSCVGLILLNWQGYMEHLGGILMKKLEKGKTYIIKLQIKSAGNGSRFFAKHIGIKFSNEKYIFNKATWGFYDGVFKTNKIRADFSYNEFITDTAWQLIEGEYIAEGGEQYFTIGTFYNEGWDLTNKIQHYMKINLKPKKREKFWCKNQDILLVNSNYSPNNFLTDESYYFIDNVSVELKKIPAFPSKSLKENPRNN